MTPSQQEDVRKLLERYDEVVTHPNLNRSSQELMLEACGQRAIQYLRTHLREVQEAQPDPRAGRRIAPVEVYTILNKALKERRLEDRLSPLATEIANLSRIDPPFQSDDHSTDPSKWSMSKLRVEKAHGMSAVLEEWDRRTGG